MKGISDRIRLARRRQGWSQTELAERIAVTASAVGHWERTGGSSPSSARLRAIATELGVTVEWLATGRVPMQLLEPDQTDSDSTFLDADEEKLVSQFRLLPPPSRDTVFQIISLLCQ